MKEMMGSEKPFGLRLIGVESWGTNLDKFKIDEWIVCHVGKHLRDPISFLELPSVGRFGSMWMELNK